MNVKHIKAGQVEKNDYGSVRVKNLLDEEKYKALSIAEIEVIGEQKFGLDKESDTAYYVLEGTGTFFIEEKEFKVKKGDLIFIPKNTKYKDTVGLKLLAISVPKFNRDKRVRFD